MAFATVFILNSRSCQRKACDFYGYQKKHTERMPLKGVRCWSKACLLWVTSNSSQLCLIFLQRLGFLTMTKYSDKCHLEGKGSFSSQLEVTVGLSLQGPHGGAAGTASHVVTSHPQSWRSASVVKQDPEEIAG